MQGLQEECVECGTSTSAGRVHIDRTCRGGVESRLEEEWREGGKGLEQERKEAWMKVPWVVDYSINSTPIYFTVKSLQTACKLQTVSVVKMRNTRRTPNFCTHNVFKTWSFRGND